MSFRTRKPHKVDCSCIACRNSRDSEKVRIEARVDADLLAKCKERFPEASDRELLEMALNALLEK